MNTLRRISKELVKRVNQEQRLLKSGTRPPRDLFRKNTKRLKEIIRHIGWPTTKKVGEDASWRAWLIAQHSDEDVKFQKKALCLMKKSANSVRAEDIAYLEDRVRVNTRRPQLYGTQFFIDSKGNYGARPIQNPQKVDERRKSVGLEPFAQYEKHMKDKARRAKGE